MTLKELELFLDIPRFYNKAVAELSLDGLVHVMLSVAGDMAGALGLP